MVVSILGCGWYGRALAGSLIKEGIIVKGSTTLTENLAELSTIGIKPFVVKIAGGNNDFDAEFFKCDILVVNIPPKFRKGETAEYLPKIKQIIDAIQQSKLSKVIYISSTGVYGDHNSEVNESSDPAPDNEPGSILLEAENLFQQQNSFKTTITRFAGLIGPGRDPGRFFAGKSNIPNGKAPVNLIHLDDCIGITHAVIKQNAFGHVFNACSPEHPAKADFYRQAARRAGLPLPEFIDELNTWKIVKSVNLPDILNYNFKTGIL
jgi:nucleoside-diphosphate-sugar epimerase